MRRELDVREQEMDARFESLREREAALAELPGDTTNPGEDEAHSLVDSVQLMDEPDSLADSVQALDADEDHDVHDHVLDADVLDADMLDGEELLEADDLVEDDLIGDVEALEPDDLEEVSPDEVVSLSDDVLEDDLEGHVEDLDGGETVVRPSEEEEEAPRKSKSILPTPATPPDAFYSDPQIEMVAGMADQPWLFARLQRRPRKRISR